jgi:glycosyltransferase involved in cell wall biosynthesis
MTPVKGFHVLIDAMQEVGAKRSDIRLQIFGDGPERPQLESLVSRQPRCNTVLQPFVPRAKLVQTYSSADVFMLPSLYESQGLVLMEAMACGLPCIASDLPCFRGIVRDADNAVLVKPGDPAALAEKISWLADNRGMLRKLGANARATILELPTWREIAKRTLSAYEKFLRR